MKQVRAALALAATLCIAAQAHAKSICDVLPAAALEASIGNTIKSSKILPGVTSEVCWYNTVSADGSRGIFTVTRFTAPVAEGSESEVMTKRDARDVVPMPGGGDKKWLDEFALELLIRRGPALYKLNARSLPCAARQPNENENQHDARCLANGINALTTTAALLSKSIQ